MLRHCVRYRSPCLFCRQPPCCSSPTSYCLLFFQWCFGPGSTRSRAASSATFLNSCVGPSGLLSCEESLFWTFRWAHMFRDSERFDSIGAGAEADAWLTLRRFLRAGLFGHSSGRLNSSFCYGALLGHQYHLTWLSWRFEAYKYDLGVADEFYQWRLFSVTLFLPFGPNLIYIISVGDFINKDGVVNKIRSSRQSNSDIAVGCEVAAELTGICQFC